MIVSSDKQHQKDKSIVYTSEDFRNIRDNVWYDQHYRKLSGQKAKIIRNLRINKKKKRGSKAGRSKRIDQQRTVNLSNLIRINSEELPRNVANQKTIKINTINVQSVKNKDMILYEYIWDNKIDLCLMTETWLTDSDTDKGWKSCTVLNNSNLRKDTSNRIGQQQGGLALVYSTSVNVTKVDEEIKRSFQFAIWKVTCKEYTITIICVYHPPYSNVNQCTNTMFLDKFTEWLPDQLTKYKNIIMMGGINFHLNKFVDPDAVTFKDTLDALGLRIHNNFPSHRHGNTLDIIATEIASNLNITTCQPGPFLSDHGSIECTTNIIREDIIRETVSFRKIKDINTQKFQDDVVTNF